MLLQFSFFSTLPPIFSTINLPLATILLVLLFFGPTEALISAFFFGFLLDSWHFSAFGTYTLSFLVIVALAQLFLNNWLTDRSLYSFLVLVSINSLAYCFLWSLLNFLFTLGSGVIFFLFSWSFLKNTLLATGWLIIICGLSFIFLSLFSRRLKPVFLKRN